MYMFKCIYLYIRIVVENETCDKFAGWSWLRCCCLTFSMGHSYLSHFSWVAIGLTTKQSCAYSSAAQTAQSRNFVRSAYSARNIQTNPIKCKRFASHIQSFGVNLNINSRWICAYELLRTCVLRLKAGHCTTHTGTYLFKDIKSHTVCNRPCASVECILSRFFIFFSYFIEPPITNTCKFNRILHRFDSLRATNTYKIH